MELRKLGKSEVEVTPMAFGAWAIGGWMWGGAEASAAIRAIRTSYEAGITTIGTAPVYGFGHSEELVGRALQGVPRDRFQILTKYGLNWGEEGGRLYFEDNDNDGNPIKVYKWASKRKVIEECEQSLRRLKTDYIDLYQIHWPDVTTPIEENMEAVQLLMEQGKIRAAGVCNYNAEQVNEALKTLPLASNQVPYSMINRGIEKDVIPQAIERGISIIPYSPLQRGLLTGKIKPGHHFNEGDSRKTNPFYSDVNIKQALVLLDEIKDIAEKHKATLAQLVIHWTMQQPAVACVLVGARDEDQVMDNVGSLSFSLSQEELEKISQAANKFVLANG